MRSLPLHLSWRFGRNAALSAAGMGLCIAFAVLGFSVVHGLEAATYGLSEPMREAPWAVARPGLEPFAPEEAAVENATGVLVANVVLQDGTALTLVAWQGPEAPMVAAGTVRPGRSVVLPETVQVEEPVRSALTRGATLEARWMPQTWGATAPETLRALDPRLGGANVSYLLAGGLSEADREDLRSRGFLVTQAPAVLPFFHASTREVAGDLWLIVLFSSALVTLLSYEFMQTEVREKRREIGIWRALGLRGRDVLRLLLVRAGLLTGMALAVGWGLSAAALGLASRTLPVEAFSPSLSMATAGATGLAFLLAGTLGAWLPARAAARGAAGKALEARP